MNRLVWNYLAKVERVLDAQTFECTFDFGVNRFERTRLQLLKPHPGFLNGVEERLKDRARVCLEYLLHVGGREGPGRTIIVSPERPNAYNKFYVTAYVFCKQQNMMLPSSVGPRYAGYRFVHVNHLLAYLAEHEYEFEISKRVIESFDLLESMDHATCPISTAATTL